MNKIATTTIATAGLGIAALTLSNHDADAAQNNGYNSNDPYSYSYSYTIDQDGNYHYTWEGNWNKSNQFNNYYGTYAQYNNNNTANNNYTNYTSYNTQATAPRTGGLGASYSTSDNNVKVTTTSAPKTSTNTFANRSSSGANLYTVGQCTYYVFDKVGGKIGSTWGNANNWANAAAASGYTVNNNPSAGAILQTSQGAFGHVAYVESVNSDGSVNVSEMNYGQGPGVVTTRTISASQAGGYNYIH
ncbi:MULTISPECIES: CHAP domain-containing protein [Staphylococcus]|uniref:Peptidase C51 domain-containing protein n=2 Tax=Staphylococcus TaxID=1279 RepID=A0ABN0PFD2_STASI|nr:MULTISPECIES: CHAP domain-containing protein [Staphylococcus]AVO01476.1 CHAP domain-containing protein [Staphylococcus simulans]AVO04428.1 CHAP domain-containing protein [Staphylococcus simulans]AWG18024.1 CHAP domain-containing protein [Staphylococcus simulans]AWI00993.1 CHAP domain-containing protein [Staphylococcus simulans]ERS94301.1 hypothetical protein SSIM_02290 [Staphylococcus simulans UMC-CNS-990]